MILPDPAYRISRRAVWYWTVRDGVLVVAVAGVVAVIGRLAPFPRTVSTLVLAVDVAVALAGLAAVLGLAFWRYAVHRWEATDTVIVTRAGAVFRDWRVVPLHRVQTVEVSQGVLERAFRVARLVVRTASYSGSTDIAGMDADEARRVAAHLTATLTGHARAGRNDDGA